VETNECSKRKDEMRSDYGLYVIAIICFFLAFLIFFMGYAQGSPVHVTGGEVTDLVIMMFSAILGAVFFGLGYVVRPKKVTPSPPPTPKPSAPSKPETAKSKKKKKAVKK